MSQPTAAPPGRRRHGGGTAGDMVRSLLVIGVLVAFVVLAVPRPQGRIEQPVDVGAAASQARSGGLDVAEPAVPRGWRANTATFGPDVVDGLPTFSVGYVLPDETFAGVRVTDGATPAWLDGVTSGGRPAGEREVAGATWQELTSPEGQRWRSLVLVEGGRTTAVTGTAPDAQLDALATAVVASSSAADAQGPASATLAAPAVG